VRALDGEELNGTIEARDVTVERAGHQVNQRTHHRQPPKLAMCVLVSGTNRWTRRIRNSARRYASTSDWSAPDLTPMTARPTAYGWLMVPVGALHLSRDQLGRKRIGQRDTPTTRIAA
jgi:hypothetical protein